VGNSHVFSLLLFLACMELGEQTLKNFSNNNQWSDRCVDIKKFVESTQKIVTQFHPVTALTIIGSD
jgi:hypothetical protein